VAGPKLRFGAFIAPFHPLRENPTRQPSAHCQSRRRRLPSDKAAERYACGSFSVAFTFDDQDTIMASMRPCEMRAAFGLPVERNIYSFLKR